jgi:hypothetical protein
LALRDDRRYRVWIAAVGVFGVGLAAFAVAKLVLVPSAGSTSVASGSSVTANIRLLLRSVDPGLVRWGASHLVVEIGAPLLLGGVWIAARCVRSRQWRPLLAAVAGVGPSLLLYIGNPSPPRHFYVAATGLACFVAVGVPTHRVQRLSVLVPLILFANLLFPWTLMPADGKSYPDRSVVTYNVIERSDRNRAEIRAAFPFYGRLIAAAHARPVVLFASWVHAAQIASLLVNDPAVRLEQVVLPGNVRASALRRPGLELYLVETYDASFVTAAVSEFRRRRERLACLSLVEGATSVNDLGLAIPKEIYWWSA